MNDIIENNDAPLTPEQVSALMAKLHEADEAGAGEAAPAEGTIFVAEDSEAHPTGTIQ